MTDTNRHDSPADRRNWSHIHEHLKARAQKVRDGQGQLQIYSQFPEPDIKRSNQRGGFLVQIL